MKLYLVVLEDRRIGVKIEVYANRDAALARAQEIVEKYDCDKDDDSGPLPEHPSYLFGYRLSCEGDCVHVKETELKE